MGESGGGGGQRVREVGRGGEVQGGGEIGGRGGGGGQRERERCRRE